MPAGDHRTDNTARAERAGVRVQSQLRPDQSGDVDVRAHVGACTGSGTPTTVDHTYDQADRITDAGYSYDDFGRTLAVPSVDAGGDGSLTLGYYTNDLAQSVSQTVAGVTTTKTYGLDPAGRVLTESRVAARPLRHTNLLTATAGNASAAVRGPRLLPTADQPSPPTW